MYIHRLSVFLAFFLVFISPKGQAQFSLDKYSPADTIKGSIYDKGDLVDGQYFPIIRKSKNSHPFYGYGNWMEADIHFKGEWFQDQYVLFNIYENVLYVGVKSNSTIHPHKINQEAVEEFYIEYRRFKRLQSDQLLFWDGFYEVILEGTNVSFYINHRKTEILENTEVYYKETDVYYFLHQDTYKIITTRRSIFKHFKEIKPKLRKFVKENKLNPKNGKIYDLTRLFQYINTLQL